MGQNMHHVFKVATAMLLGSLAVTISIAADRPFVTVNGAIVSQADADAYISQAKSQGMPDTPELRNHVREEVIRRELMFQKAQKAGFDKKPDVAAQAEDARQKLIAQAEAARELVIIRAYVQDFIKTHPIGDSELKSMYEAMKAKGGDTEYNASVILVKTEEEADSIIARLNKGSAFASVAKESIDPNSKYNGGNVGWSSPSKFVKPVADALGTLKKGQYTKAPVKSGYGYYVIELDDTRPLKVPSFEEMKPMLVQQAQAQMIDRMIAGLRADAKVE
jgi:peptidyl-prolyl cis-trans isomerase C